MRLPVLTVIQQQTNARMITDATSSTVPPSPCVTEDARQGRASFVALPLIYMRRSFDVS